MRTLVALAVLGIGLSVGPARGQANPPPLLNYQGVLRGASNEPLSGSYDMVFRFCPDSACVAPILEDGHLAAGTGAVTVSGGLFNVPLGSGALSDGSGPGVYTSLSEVFRDHEYVYLEVSVAGEVLLPRTRVVSAGYALNADHLNGLRSESLLRSDATDAYSAGTLTFALGTVLDVGGAFRLSGIAVTSDAAELNKLDGTGPTVTAANLTDLTDGGPADPLHTHASVANAGTLDSLDSTQFLRSDTSDSFTSGTLTVSAGATLQVSGNLYANGSIRVDQDGPEATQTIYFYDLGSPVGEQLRWDEPDDRFEVSAGLATAGPIRTGTTTAASVPYNQLGQNGSPESGMIVNLNDTFVSANAEIGGTLHLSNFLRMSTGPDGIQSIFFFNDGSQTGEVVQWDEADQRFEISDELALDGPIRLGTRTAVPVAYNHLGSAGTPNSGDMGNTGDLYVSNDLEVDGTLYANTVISLNGNGPNANSFVEFWEGVGYENLAWIDADSRFQLTDDLIVIGDLSATGAKPFVQNHPYRPDLSVVYVALEGGEAATYTRGSARLVGGVARVTLDETFALVTNPEIGLTAHLTARGAPADLYVESLTTRELVVRAAEGGVADAAFDYFVYGLRIGFEEWNVVQPRRADAPIPKAAHFERALGERPELRAYTPLDRFRRMSGTVVPRATAGADTSAGALRAAVGEYDPEADRPGAGPETADEPAVTTPSRQEPPGTTAARPETLSPDGAIADSSAVAPYPIATGLVAVYAADEALSAGDVVVLDPERPGVVRRGDTAFDRSAIGIVVDGAALRGGESDGRVAVALPGTVVPCKVDAGYGAIAPGDLLTVSATPGHAMRSNADVPGTIVGKSLGALASGTGAIQVLVMLR